MPRRRRAEIREVAPDAVYNSTLVEKFVNSLMWQGKKNTAQGIFYDAMEKIKERTSDDPLKALQEGRGERQADARSEDAARGRRQLPGADRSAAEPADFAGHALDHHQRPRRVPKRAWRKSWPMN